LAAEVLKVSPDAPEAQLLQYAASYIGRGEVISIPTDTFYGLAADPLNLKAVEAIYRAKGRPEQKPLPILVRSLEQAVELTRDLPETFLKLTKKFWPGALTLVVEGAHKIPLKVTGNTGRIALRWPNSKVACALIEAAGIPVTGTSANVSGFAPCSSATQVFRQMGERLPLIIDAGETGATLPSTIIEIRGDDWRILREGGVPEAEIVKALSE
jgi:tRNA threonylcarbamoyl adenosine modification protein (Sua5/YciO/YrdC/YwlC family)